MSGEKKEKKRQQEIKIRAHTCTYMQVWVGGGGGGTHAIRYIKAVAYVQFLNFLVRLLLKCGFY